MNALALIMAIPLVMWAVQSVMLLRAGRPLRIRIDARKAPPGVRTAGRITTQVCLVLAILVYPQTVGREPLDYYGSLLPGTRSALLFPHGAAAAILFLCVLFLVWVVTGRVQIDVHQSRRKWMRRLILLVPTALFGAFVEELLFRGVVLADLLRTEWIPTGAAVIIGALVFAGAHYVRMVKRHWTLPGHVMLGVLLCMAFLRTGTIWLAAGLHAGGILMIMGLRPFVRYRGPSWMTGASIFPFAGAVGVAGLGILTIFVAGYYGAP